MNIAFINFEYPPDIVNGGIATYVHQAARMLAARGNRVEVFAASRHRCGTFVENGVTVHRTLVTKEIDFPTDIVGIFNERHKHKNFDVIEGPEFRAYARGVVDANPEIPFAVKLHTPVAAFKKWDKQQSIFDHSRLRVILGELRRGINPFGDLERKYALKADLIAAPSHAIGNLLIDMWGLDPQKIVHFPYPYIPSPELHDVPAATNTGAVIFLGRLEIRKGVVDLAQAIPLILGRHPNARFRFVGENCKSPDGDEDMQQYLMGLLGESARAVDFVGKIKLDEIPREMALADVSVIPSHFDNFPGVCLESMSAARGVVATNSGGMAEMLPTEEFGLLVPPEAPAAIAAAVARLLDDPERRIRMGEAARRRVLAEYNADRVGERQERFYEQVIEQHHRPASGRAVVEPGVVDGRIAKSR